MKTFDVQAISISAPATAVFDYVANPNNLPRWTNAFESADTDTALMLTPNGAVTVDLRTVAQPDAGTIDWIMHFPDGSVATAYSRVTPEGEAGSVFSFVLMAPPVPLEALEGALDAQREILAEELQQLKQKVEAA